MIKLQDIKVPSLVVSKDQMNANLDKMLQKAMLADVGLRPHFKTHQLPEVGKIFRDKGIQKITVSSVSMASVFAEDNWKDILIAVPVNIREIGEVNKLASRIQLGLLVDSTDAVTFLSSALLSSVDVYIKIDCGYGRVGVNVNAWDEVAVLAKEIGSSKRMNLKGLVAHFGDTYNAGSEEEITTIHSVSVRNLNALRTFLHSNFGDLSISVGDTPSLSVLENWQDFEEARPGNFIYYDAMQYTLGACSFKDISALVACPVIAKYPEREEVVVYGGAVHLSKESLVVQGLKNFGMVVEIHPDFTTSLMEGVYVKKLSQEHGTLHVPSHRMANFSVGGLIGVIPIHSCLSANLLKKSTFII